jgi:quinoprotein glucose dehydrogenase
MHNLKLRRPPAKLKSDFFPPNVALPENPMDRSFLPILFLPFLGLLSFAADTPEKPYTPNVKAASDEGEKAMVRFRKPKGVEVKLWAAEPLLANPVSFCFDEKGRVYVAETYRLHHGVTDNRGHMNWLDDDLASRTVEDRVAMHKKFAKQRFEAEYEKEHDRVKLIWDSTGAGVADKSSVFADGFHHAEQGLGSGVLARKGNVYYTDIPDLWLLQDTKSENKADVKKSLAHGFGIHVAFLGHDMHGLRMGPDGKLYFSIGDRGLNVTTKEGKHLFNPDSGAVLRCDPDGSNMEIVHIGLRNPQELAFDAQGNLFTVDNNSDSIDRARLVQIVEGGDSGWRTGYQYGSALSDRGPFNAEKIWHLPKAEQPAYVVPPLAHITSGPSGFCFNYGATALPSRYDGHFFICDFRGSPGGSSIYSFAVKPKGASFEAVDGHEFVGGLLSTDCDFGPDGGFYASDWVDGWELTGKGRIYRFADSEAEKNPILAETKKLLADGFDKRSNDELAKLLEHPDLRVRQESQFALADKGKEAMGTLNEIAGKSKNVLARLHAIWGLGQLARREEGLLGSLRPLLKDADDQVRAQAGKVLGSAKGATSADLLPLLKDSNLRVRFEALTSLGNPHVTFADGDADRIWTALEDLLKENTDRDAYLRHAASLVMARYPGQTLVSTSVHQSPSVRLAAVLALRQRKSPDVSAFLDDTDPQIATEAARVLHDVIDEPTSGKPLADRLAKSKQSEFFLWRALNANYRLGKAENAAAVARFAASSDAPERLRVEAVKMLGDWANPPRRDKITGLSQNLGTRDSSIPAEAFKSGLGGLFTGPNAVRTEAAKVAATLGIKEVGPALFDLAADGKRPASVRVEMLRALDALKDAKVPQATELALKDAEPLVRAEGRHLLAKAKPAEALPILVQALESGTTIEKQAALTTLGEMQNSDADAVLGKSLGQLLDKKLPGELHLELLDAAAKRQSANDIKDKLAKFEASRSKTDHLSAYRESLLGGDADAGRRIFQTKAEVSCIRCHKVKGEGGEVGPELFGLAAKQNREYLLESIVDPNKQIAQGYETVVLTLTNGKAVSGILKAETPKEVKLMTAEGQLITIAKDKIEDRSRGKSPMPEDTVKHLTKRELRDLVEFLAGLK